MSINLKFTDFSLSKQISYSDAHKKERRDEDYDKNRAIDKIVIDLARNFILKITTEDKNVTIIDRTELNISDEVKLKEALSEKVKNLDKSLQEKDFSGSDILKILLLAQQNIFHFILSQYVDKITSSELEGCGSKWIPYSSASRPKVIVDIEITPEKNILLKAKGETHICKLKENGLDTDNPIFVFRDAVVYDLKADKFIIRNEFVPTLSQKIQMIFTKIVKYLELFFNWIFNRHEKDNTSEKTVLEK